MGLEYGTSFSVVFIKSTAHAAGLDPLLCFFFSLLNVQEITKEKSLNQVPPKIPISKENHNCPIVYFICVFKIIDIYFLNVRSLLSWLKLKDLNKKGFFPLMNNRHHMIGLPKYIKIYLLSLKFGSSVVLSSSKIFQGVTFC